MSVNIRTESHRFISPTMSSRVAVVVACLVGVAGWLSISPYPFHGTTLHLLVGAFATSASLTALVGLRRLRMPNLFEIVGLVLLTVFLCYLSLLPRMDGSTSKWIFVLPTLWTLSLMPNDMRARALGVFKFLFAVSLVPAILISIWMIVGLPIELRTMPYYHPTMAADGNMYVYLPGALFVEGNSVALPWGGIFFRTSAIYDEPGMVGTIAALILAAYRFRLASVTHLIIVIGGILSGSLAFFVLCALGLAIRILAFVAAALASGGLRSRRIALASIAMLATMLAFAFVIDGSRSDDRPAPVHREAVDRSIREEPATVVVRSGAAEREVAVSGAVRTTGFSNRNLSDFNALLDEYWQGDVATILFGIAADATAQRAPTSQVFHRVYIDYGLVGFALLAGGFGAFSFGAVRAWSLKGLREDWGVAMFVLLFLVSFYQRPTIWLPYALTIFLCGLATSRIEPRGR